MARGPGSEIYRAGVNPGGAAVQPGASAAAFGAAVGEGIGELGGSMERAALREREQETQRRRETQAADAGVALARIGGELEAAIDEARASAAPAAAGHSAFVQKSMDEREADFLASLTDERVRDVYRTRFAEMRSRIEAREQGWALGQRVEHDATQLDEQGTLAANRQATKPDVDALEEDLGNIETAWAERSLPAGVREKGVREQQRKVVVAWANAVQLTDPAALERVLDAGVFAAYLEPNDIDQLRRGALIEQRRAAAAAAAAEADRRAEAREKAQTFGALVSEGVELTDAQWADYEAQAAVTGDDSLKVKIAADRTRQGINRETRDFTPAQFDAEIGALRAKADRTPDEDIRLNQLEAIRGPRVAEFNSDPQGAAARRGSPAPALDLAAPTPDQVRGRVAWARGQRQAAGLGYTPYLSAAEMQPWKDRLETGGAAARVEVGQELRRTFGVGIGSEIARQIAGDDRELELVIGLPAGTARHYAQGEAALKRNKDLHDGLLAREVFAEIQEAIPPQYREAAFNAARNIGAGMSDAANAQAFDEGVYRMALHRALGATGAPGALKGGLGEWNGAPLWLPPEMSQAEVERRLSRADGKQWGAAAVDAAGAPRPAVPHYVGADGKPGRALWTGEIRALRLRTIAPGIYELPGAIDAKGRPWRFDVRRLP